MRLISQDGMIDVNYDNGSLVVGFGEYKDCVKAIISYYDNSSQRGTKLAEYSSKAKTLKVMEMLREEYLEYCTARSSEYWFAFNNPKVFQFPKDEEVEV